MRNSGDGRIVAAVAAAGSALQAVFLRGFMAVCGGNELTFGALLAGYLLWIAAGAKAWRWIRRPAQPAMLAIIFAVTAAGEALLLRETGVVFRLLAGLLGVTWTSGEIAPFMPAAITAFFIGAPSNIASGMLFTLAVSRVREHGAVGRIYSAEACGHVAGFLGVTLALWLGAPDVSVMIFIPIAALAGLPVRARVALPALVVLSVVAPAIARPLERLTSDRGGLLPATPIAVKSTPFREVAVVGSREEFTVYSDARPVCTYPAHGMYSGLRLGIAMSRLGRALLVTEDIGAMELADGAGFTEVRAAAIDAAAMELGGRVLGNTPDAPLRRVDLPGDTLGTVRRLLPGSISFVLVDLPDPLSISDNRYMTVEFQEGLKAAAAGDGVIVERLGIVSGGVRGASERLVRRVYSTLRAVFGHVLVFDDDTEVVFMVSGSSGDISGAARDAAARLLESERPEDKTAGLWAGLPRHRELTALLEGGREIWPDTLRRPNTFLERLRIERSMDAPGAVVHRRPWFSGAAASSLIPAVLLLSAFGIAKRRTRLLIALDAFCTGVLAMGVEVVCLFAYQAAAGMMYLFSAAAIAVFMAGFFLGARHAVMCERSKTGRMISAAPWLPLAAGVAAVVYVALLPVAPLVTETCLVAVMGLTGYACALNLSLLPRRDEDTVAAAAAVNAADNLGGAAGAVMAALVLAPFLGLSLTLVYVIVLKFATALAVCRR